MDYRGDSRDTILLSGAYGAFYGCVVNCGVLRRSRVFDSDDHWCEFEHGERLTVGGGSRTVYG